MSKHRPLVYGQPVPQSFLDALQEFIGSMGSPNLDLTMAPGSSTQVQIVAGTGSNQVSLGIDGLWRYITSTTSTTVPTGVGTSGTYDIFVTCGDNSFSTNPSPPPPELDATSYAFALVTPVLQGNVPSATHYRKVGEAITDGTRILSLRQTVDIDSSQGFQPGDLKMSAAANPQAGWLLCNGQAVSRSTYAALYAALGGTGSPWGQGDGSTTFNAPDLRSRMPVGAGQGAGLTNRVLGSYSTAANGEESHALLTTEMPSHNHGGATGTGATGTGATGGGTTGGGTTGGEAGHTHPQFGQNGSFGFAGGGISDTFLFPAGAQYNTGAGSNHVHSVPGLSVPGLSVPSLSVPALSITPQGGGGLHNTMPPWAAVNWFVKT